MISTLFPPNHSPLHSNSLSHVALSYRYVFEIIPAKPQQGIEISIGVIVEIIIEIGIEAIIEIYIGIIFEIFIEVSSESIIQSLLKLLLKSTLK